ncbi:MULTISPECIES: hypothetical protein [unclassified Lysobacter]|uniref:hypothetical protein n=1 Tax=unclassified Lysobacter TaxID=2635362 RepID=UPI001BECDD28|nr:MULTISPECIES: hypothetical protein [unclassified Lysobacter]MBT2746552.1 hypothetical protein [Lysobacter sp. ISL-42]MBT2754005.1 hypothetical protein [Lysobacter sp. ISL-50]MBT2778921.1 hypothetical protein [Lysobacter sp. ISL-54]MBT2782502.1 hypothetical protein [Lysobacter sp. ISL-52]
MPIRSELQAKIDALEDEDLRARILRVLTGPGKKRASDEEIYETALAGYAMAKEQQARLRKWRDDEVVFFCAIFQGKKPEDYSEFLRQQKEFNQIESELAWRVRRLMREWMPDLNSDDRSELFSKLRDYVKLNLV